MKLEYIQVCSSDNPVHAGFLEFLSVMHVYMCVDVFPLPIKMAIHSFLSFFTSISDDFNLFLAEIRTTNKYYSKCNNYFLLLAIK